MKRRAHVAYLSQPRPGEVTHSSVALDLSWPVDRSALAELRQELDSEQGRPTVITSLAWLEPEPEPEPEPSSAPWTTRTAAFACAAWLAFGVAVATVLCLTA